MSDIADRVRTQRQVWAAPGSRHDRFVTLARWMLPSAIGVLTAFLVMAPIYSSSEVSFVLDKKKVEVAQERMKIQAAQLGRAGGPAQQAGRRDPPVRRPRDGQRQFGPL